VGPLRIYAPGAWYHLTARGNERRDIFRGAEHRFDREIYVMAADGSNPVRISRHPASDTNPSWSRFLK